MLLASFAAVSRPAEAVPSGCKGTPGITTYYSDATRTTIVGNYFSGCPLETFFPPIRLLL
jgi:hypothetical protein